MEYPKGFRIILLLSCALLLVIIGVSVNAWYMQPIERLIDSGRFHENNVNNVSTDGFNVSVIDAFRIAKGALDNRRVSTTFVRPDHRAPLENGTIIEGDYWVVGFWHVSRGKEHRSITIVIVDAITGGIIDAYTEISRDE